MALTFPNPAMEARPVAIVLRDVGMCYDGETWALRDVNLTVREGEFVSLLGPSGCGKSTILRTIAGLQTVTSGSVEVLGSPAGELFNRRGELSFVFQEPTLMPWRSVLANVALPLELMGVPKRERLSRAMEMLAMVGLDSVANKLPRQLSGGMKMRVSIARALVSNPKLLLLDEPFAALDEITRERLQEELLRLWQRFGMTVVFVTHNVFEAVYLSSRVVVMQANPGTVRAELSIETPYPRSREVIGTPDFMNMVAKAVQLLGD
ncbi:nitrate/sulfonate/bicarbonate ABC transporter ATP-binding protein [Alicyclobacillus cellulosilyticus]|uniref:Nitrate/sulfonate/bicarbonate ABC transporter ATP-binding protein n=1 Tax=Alicyclobacillus cellulosilyticus TaxID=1003997 RepID=A0A917NPB9_9BACL|nr:ABC transporter ATP-binding protein [Alicyclobacillus cellulosilyticus]GGJ12749.1 nitrate/sulfonate/bicarbonate ABC transporter ATP-binding protein [Alicyclobacillus cellulosilyticus]